MEVTGDQSLFMSRMALEPEVAYAENNVLYRTTHTPDDPRWDEQWGPAAINAPSAWDIEQGSADVLIAIVDTGID